jgi:hypothetical protein
MYIRFPGVEPTRKAISAAGSAATHIGTPSTNRKGDARSAFLDKLFDESSLGKYDSFGRPLSPLKGLTPEELEEQRRRLLAEAEERSRREAEEQARWEAEEAERLRLEAEEAERLRLLEEAEKKRLFDLKMAEEEEFRKRKEEAERKRKAELDR